MSTSNDIVSLCTKQEQKYDYGKMKIKTKE